MDVRVDQRMRWLTWSLGLVLAVLSTALVAIDPVLPGDALAARAVQEAHGLPVLPALSDALYRLGQWPASLVIALVAALVAWMRGNPRAGVFLLLTLWLRPIGTLIKEIVQRPRPTEDVVPAVEGAAGFAFPSGHVFGTVLLVGFIAYLLVEHQQIRHRRRPVIIAVGGIVLAMALQRIYAGAHWPTDTLGGIVWGGVFLFLLVQAYLAVSRSASLADPGLCCARPTGNDQLAS